jgi:hypothetical protein
MIDNGKSSPFGLLSDSYYICRYFEPDGMMREFHSGKLEGKKALLQ